VFAGPVLLASCASLLLAMPAAAQPTSGTPVSGTSVGLDPEPEGLRIEPRQTDARGSVAFTGLAPGRYTVYLADVSTLKAPVRVSVRVSDGSGRPGTTRRVSEPIRPATGADKAYALDQTGRRLVVETPNPRPNGQGSGAGQQSIWVDLLSVGVLVPK